MSVYLDHNATTALLPEVFEAMQPWLGIPANPSSAHQFGQRAAMAVEIAREQVAALFGASPAGVVFTSGATEANHLFLRGCAPRVLALTPLEHPSVTAAARRLEAQGTQIVWLPVGADGRAVVTDVPPEADVVSLMAANHETGVLQPVLELQQVAADHQKLHVDATQAAGRVPLQLGAVDGITLSAHKLGGPGGVGALVLPDGDPFPALVSGGSQERGRRAGTVHTAGVVGFGAACALALEEMELRMHRWSEQQQTLVAGIKGLGGRVVGENSPRLGNTVCAVWEDWEGELLVQALDLRGVAVSHGAACSSGSLEASPTLVAMGEAHPEAAVRISLGPRTSDADIEAVLGAMAGILEGSTGA